MFYIMLALSVAAFITTFGVIHYMNVKHSNKALIQLDTLSLELAVKGFRIAWPEDCKTKNTEIYRFSLMEKHRFTFFVNTAYPDGIKVVIQDLATGKQKTRKVSYKKALRLVMADKAEKPSDQFVSL